jgi:hypothetical protein
MPSGTVLVGNFRGASVGRSEPEDDDSQRMRVNIAAAAALLVLIAIGIWLTSAMVESQKVHGCYSSGEHTCSLI